MKLFVKVIKITLLVFFLSLCTLLITGWLLQDRIVRFAMDELGTTFGAPLAADEVSFSLVSNFPQASLKFDNLWLGRYRYNDSNEILATDTLAKFNKLFVSLNAKALINEVIKIKNVEVKDGFARYAIDSTGAMIYDYLMPVDSSSTADDEASTPLDLTVDEISLTNITLRYSDDLLKAKANVFIPQLNSSVRMNDDNLNAKANGKIELSQVRYEGTHADRLKQANLEFDIAYDSDTVYAKVLKLDAGDLTLEAIGKVFVGDEIYTDLSLDISAPSLAALTKYAPEAMLSEYEVSQIAGKLKVNTKVEGIIGDELPFYHTNIDLSNASIKYQDYPLVYNVELKTTATNGTQKNNSTTTIQLKTFKADCSGNHLNLSGNFSNLDRLNFNVVSYMDLDLDASKAYIPDSLFKSIGGNISATISSKGVAPDSVDNQFIEAMLQNTTANIRVNNVNLAVDSLIDLRKLSAEFNYKKLSFELKKLNVYLPEYEQTLVDNSMLIQLSGDVMNPDLVEVNIPAFYFATPESTLKGKASVEAGKKVTFAIASHMDLDLDYLKKYAPDTLVNNMKGHIIANVQSKGKIHLDSIADQIEPILYNQSAFDIEMKNITLDMKDTLMNVKDLNGKISFADQNVTIRNFKGTYSNIDFNVESTNIYNLVQTVVKNQPGILKVDGVYRFGDLDYRVLAAFAGEEESGTKTSEPKTEEEPTAWNYEILGELYVKSFKYDTIIINGIRTKYDVNDKTNLLKGDVNVDQTLYGTTVINKAFTKYEMNMASNEVKGKLTIKDVKYEDALLEDISALYNVNDTTYTIDQMEIKGFGGNTNSSIQVHLREKDKMEIEMKSTIKNMNIRRLMKEMKDFDQKEMTYEQLNGIVSSDNFFMRMTMIDDSLIYDDLRMTCDLTFEDGGIYHYPPVQDMAQYLPKVDNLDTMSFKTISSHLFLFKDAVYVPRTYVVSNVFDVEAIGMQSFGEDYQYHIGVNLYQLLGKKNKTNTDKDGPTKRKKMIRLKATGRKGKYKSGFDKVKDRDAMEIRVKTQEKILEFRFQPKFFNFETGVDE